MMSGHGHETQLNNSRPTADVYSHHSPARYGGGGGGGVMPVGVVHSPIGGQLVSSKGVVSAAPTLHGQGEVVSGAHPPQPQPPASSSSSGAAAVMFRSSDAHLHDVFGVDGGVTVPARGHNLATKPSPTHPPPPCAGQSYGRRDMSSATVKHDDDHQQQQQKVSLNRTPSAVLPQTHHAPSEPSFYLMRSNSAKSAAAAAAATGSQDVMTGPADLMVSSGLQQLYLKMTAKRTKDKLSSLLPHIPGDINETGDAKASLHALYEKPPIGGKELMPLNQAQLSGFRLHPGPMAEEFKRRAISISHSSSAAASLPSTSNAKDGSQRENREQRKQKKSKERRQRSRSPPTTSATSAGRPVGLVSASPAALARIRELPVFAPRVAPLQTVVSTASAIGAGSGSGGGGAAPSLPPTDVSQRLHGGGGDASVGGSRPQSGSGGSRSRDHRKHKRHASPISDDDTAAAVAASDRKRRKKEKKRRRNREGADDNSDRPPSVIEL